MNKVLIAVPTAPFLDYKEHEKAFATSEWGLANTRWHRVWGRFNGPVGPRETAVRETWWKHMAPATCRFFVGRTGEESVDTVKLDCGDTYLDLIDKIRGICKWALEQDFDILFKCDTDTFCHPGLPAYLGKTDIEYGGCMVTFVAGGGPGYIMNRRAMQAVIDTPRTAFPECKDLEDHWMACAVRAAGIPATHYIGFVEEVNIQPTERLTFHPVSPEGMRQMYREFYAAEALPHQ